MKKMTTGMLRAALMMMLMILVAKTVFGQFKTGQVMLPTLNGNHDTLTLTASALNCPSDSSWVYVGHGKTFNLGTIDSILAKGMNDTVSLKLKVAVGDTVYYQFTVKDDSTKTKGLSDIIRGPTVIPPVPVFTVKTDSAKTTLTTTNFYVSYKDAIATSKVGVEFKKFNIWISLPTKSTGLGAGTKTFSLTNSTYSFNSGDTIWWRAVGQKDSTLTVKVYGQNKFNTVPYPTPIPPDAVSITAVAGSVMDTSASIRFVYNNFGLASSIKVESSPDNWVTTKTLLPNSSGGNSGKDSVQVAMHGLTQNTSYKVRGIINTSAGKDTVKGTVITLQTLPGISNPQVQTVSATLVGNKIVCDGNLLNSGNDRLYWYFELLDNAKNSVDASVRKDTIFSSPIAVKDTIFPKSPGNYYVRCTGMNSVSMSYGIDVPVIVPSSPATILASGPTTFCNGGQVTLTASPGISYLWNTGATTQSIVVTGSSNYSVAVTTAPFNFTSVSLVTVVKVNPIPTAVITGNNSFCTGGSTVLTANTGSSYAWSTGETTKSITAGTAGSYTVTLTDTNGCSATSSAKSLSVNALPVVTTTASGSTVFCQGGNVQLSSSQGVSYLWSTTETSKDITVVATGIYTVTVTDNNGCTAASSPKTVTVNPLPVATITASGPTVFCQGGSVTLTGNGGSTYKWSNGATTQSIAVSNQSNITVTTTDVKGCISLASAPVVVQVNPLPTATIAGNTPICSGDSTKLTAGGGSTFLWNTGATTQNIWVKSSGAYTVTVTDTNACASSASKSVTVNPLPNATITASGNTTLCQGSSVTLNASSGSGNTYLWSNTDATQSTVINTTGSYTVTVTNTTSGCKATSNPKTVIVNPLPSATISASGPTTFCQGGSVTLTGNGGVSYKWSNGATTQSIAVSNQSNITVTTTDVNGCTSPSSLVAMIVVHANPTPPVVTASGNTVMVGGTVTLTTNTIAPTYLWNTSGTTQTIYDTPTSVGVYNYYLTITDVNGCKATSANKAVTVVEQKPHHFTFQDATSGASIGPKTANVAFPVNIIMEDENNNKVLGFTGTAIVSLVTSSGNGVLTAGAGTTQKFSGGVTTVSVIISDKGQYSLRVIETGDPSVAGVSNSFSVTSTVGIAEEADAQRVSAYPNPCKDQFSIAGLKHGESVELCDITGRTIEVKDFSGDAVLFNCENFPNGMYFAKIKKDSSVVTIKKVVKTN